MSNLTFVLALLGLGLGLVAAVAVVALFNRVLGPARQIGGYAGHILTAGVGIACNLDGVDEAVRTRELTGAVPSLALAYLKRLGAA